MIALLLHIYSFAWIPVPVVALLVWLAVSIPTALVVAPMLRRTAALSSSPDPTPETATEWLLRVQAEWPRDEQDRKRAEEAHDGR